MDNTVMAGIVTSVLIAVGLVFVAVTIYICK